MAKRKKKNDDFIKIEGKSQDISTRKKEENEISLKKIDISKTKVYKHPFTNFTLVLSLLSSVIYFILGLFYNNSNSINALISGLLLVVFTMLYVCFSITVNKKKKTFVWLSSLFLIVYFIYGSLLNIGVISITSKGVINFTNMELTDVIKWSEKNKIDIIQDYEYSDMISEYHIISQSVEAGTKLKDVESITVAISDGPNPLKEIVIPNMVGWDSERVLEFIKSNYLSNVEVEFVKSSNAANTVIEQNKSGNIKRNDNLKLIFSYGEKLNFEEIKLKDLSGLSKFEAMFYLKQHNLSYEFEEIFSSTTKRGFVVKQSVKAGTMVKINSDKIIISISKGPEIKIPNLKGMSMSEITQWVIKNKLKLEFTDKYDDTIDENSVISANYKQGDVVAEGTLIKVVVSRGKLIMPEFKSYSDFKNWADKYSINYEEQREFSDSINMGDVIRYSHKKGATIKNNDSITVTISDGKETTVPNVVGLTKDAAANKLKGAGFGYNFVYSYSNTEKGKVVKQSISAGSKVSQGATITVTISNGPRPASSSGGGSSSGGVSSTPVTPPAPTPSCDIKTQVWLYEELYDMTNPANTCAKIKSRYPNVKFTCSYREGPTKGLVSNSSSVDGNTYSNCDTVNLVIWN